MAREVNLSKENLVEYFDRAYPVSKALTRKENEILMEGMERSGSSVEFLYNFIAKKYSSSSTCE